MFPSVKGLYGERNLTTANGKHDYIVEYKNKKYVCGSLAKYDCELPLQMHTRSKQNDFFDISTLIAIHQFGFLNNFLITSVPIKMFNDEEKQGIIKRLKKSHTITVNGVTKTFDICDVKVAPETASVYWINEPQGKTRYIDLGSRTVGYASCINENGENRFLDTESGTFFGKGLEALEDSYDADGLATFIGGKLSKSWGANDEVYLLGGGALDQDLVTGIQKFFKNATPLGNPVMSNAVGMYILGRFAYEMD
jgi:plasmid segregation protein ParM